MIRNMIKINLIKLLSIISSICFCSSVYATEVAVTVDDLPGVGTLPPGVTRVQVENQMLAAFKKHKLQNVYGMVIVGEVVGSHLGQNVINQWLSANNYVANHTYTHHDLAKVSSGFY